ncbi:putative chromate transport protein [Porphyridium purpureum]|uniref:Putative chromate transport protein n=1 Tax=Porphyridium purpureum TaxID=35688 RepID=A0A5J4Z3Q3_PORPP|nr:putative chromate transport protein [Porphyridium purpureum]|eukprot:POR0337..scf295_1
MIHRSIDLGHSMGERGALLGGAPGERSAKHGVSFGARLGDIVRYITPLGVSAFGGPQAHVAIAHRKLVDEEDWIDEDVFVGLFALSSALPGPSSTQLITSIGAYKAGMLGGFLSFFLFQVPGFLAMLFLGLLVAPAVERGDTSVSGGLAQAVLQLFDAIAPGLVAAAFAQVALASYMISQKTCGKIKLHWALNLVSTTIAVLISPEASAWVYPLMMALGGLVTLWAVMSARAPAASSTSPARDTTQNAESHDSLEQHQEQMTRVGGAFLLMIFIAISLALLFVRSSSMALRHTRAFQLTEAFWRMGGTVFGGGQVVLPMIYNEVVARGWLAENIFLYGFALVQCMPGPLFNLSVFIGAACAGVPGALLCAFGLFAPGVLLIMGCLPFWTRFRNSPRFRALMLGVNATAAGLINAALFVFLQKSLPNAGTYAVAVIAGVLSVVFGVSAPLTIVLGGVLGYLMTLLGLGRAM